MSKMQGKFGDCRRQVQLWMLYKMNRERNQFGKVGYNGLQKTLYGVWICRQWKATEVFEQGSDLATKFIFIKYAVNKKILNIPDIQYRDWMKKEYHIPTIEY